MSHPSWKPLGPGLTPNEGQLDDQLRLGAVLALTEGRLGDHPLLNEDAVPQRLEKLPAELPAEHLRTAVAQLVALPSLRL